MEVEVCVCGAAEKYCFCFGGDLCGSIQEELQPSEDMKSIALHTCFQCNETPVNVCDINMLLKRYV